MDGHELLEHAGIATRNVDELTCAQPAAARVRGPGLDAHDLPSEMWRRLGQDAAPREKTPTGLDALWYHGAGRLVAFSRTARHYLRRAAGIVDRQAEFADLREADLRQRLADVRAVFLLGRQDRAQLHTACALIREASLRTMGFRPHLVQVAAALCINDGSIGEMATGEGKTLAASISAVIGGWAGRGCHVLTFNDYLAARDAETMKPLYEFCGLTVAHVDQEMQPEDRRRAYRADVTYCTSQSVAADYLRDRIALERNTRPAAALVEQIIAGPGASANRLTLRGLDTAIVDEADSILIDEAVTPLIISGEAPDAGQTAAYQTAASVARMLELDEHYTLNRRTASISLTRTGRELACGATAVLGGLWSIRRRREELVIQALVARDIYERDRQYVIDDGKVVIVDESTGRLMPDRTWRAGLHQAVEAKEELEVSPPKETQARISFQRFFKMYRRLGGTTGTALEARSELWQIYGLATVMIPTHRPSRRHLDRDRVFRNGDAKLEAIVGETRRVHAGGRPILIGTRSVDASERLSERLTEHGLEHQVLNAVRHREEAQIVARGGQRGCITVATNMAGRGTDIKLGDGVQALGGLHVIAAERHESVRIDRQLFGRSARQGDPGSAVAYVSLDDEICRRFGPWWLRRLAARIPARFLGRLLARAAQQKAERIGSRQRQSVQRSDDWLDKTLGFAGKDG